MNRKIIEKFQGQKIKLVINGNFCLTGVIERVFDNEILFTTSEKTALIRFDRIMEITPFTRRDYYES